MQLLRPAAGGTGRGALHQAVALQRGEVLAHRGAGDAQVLGEVVDAHAFRAVQQCAEQILLGTS
ncbi:hypothetical protein D3C81_2209480 [compost metagenome]